MPSGFDDPLLNHKCTGKAGLCSRSGRPHEHLDGKEMAGWKTDRANHYHPQLCSAVAHAFTSLWAQKHVAGASALSNSRP
eukprot:1529492-Pyramimonas_sp.AAC.1